MNNVDKYADSLTGIRNEQYFLENYHKYINKNKESNFIMIDLQNFKHLNDTYGHQEGDSYLKTFASIIDYEFDDSIVARIHGDEFVILTKYNEEEIERRFKDCDDKILEAVSEKIIPKKFNFNAGSTEANENIDETLEKADAMMYFAKKNKNEYQAFNNLVWKSRIGNNNFIELFDESLEKDEFKYTVRRLHNKDKSYSNVHEVFTKSALGTSFLTESNYSLLQENSKIQKLDENNLPKLLERFSNCDSKTIINVDRKTLTLPDGLYTYKEYLPRLLSKDLKKFILGINVKGIKNSEYEKISRNINILKQFGFEISLSHYDGSIGTEIWENTNVDYIYFDDKYWKKAMVDKKIENVLLNKLDLITNYDDKAIPIFSRIEKESEHEFLESIIPDDGLLSGNNYSVERKVYIKTPR